MLVYRVSVLLEWTSVSDALGDQKEYTKCKVRALRSEGGELSLSGRVLV